MCNCGRGGERVNLTKCGRSVLGVLVDPRRNLRRIQTDESGWVPGLLVLLGAVFLGLATVPKQLRLLSEALPVVTDPLLSAQHVAIRGGLSRLVFLDRLVPTPTLLLAGIILGLVADSFLSLPRERRWTVWATIGLGLAPILVGLLGELALTYVVKIEALTPGEALTLPHRFKTGPLLFWWSDEPASRWLEVVDPRVNLISCWTVGLWAIGLQAVDDPSRLQAWHVLAPLFCLGLAGTITWASGQFIVAIILGMG